MIIQSTTDNTIVDHAELLPTDYWKCNKNTSKIQHSTSTNTRDKQQTCTVPKTKTSCVPFIEQHIRMQYIPDSAK